MNSFWFLSIQWYRDTRAFNLDIYYTIYYLLYCKLFINLLFTQYSMVPRHARLEPGQLARRGQSRERENSTGVADHRGMFKLVKLVMIDRCDDETLLLANW